MASAAGVKRFIERFPSLGTMRKAPARILRPFQSDMLDKIRETGFHPFIVVRVNDRESGVTRILVCPTQNEAGQFVNEIKALPAYAYSKLLRGIERALQLETWDAADLFFRWATEADAICEAACVGKPDDCALPTFFGYPGYSIGDEAGVPGGTARISGLIELFEAYEGTDGNNDLRFAILEALGAALSRLQENAVLETAYEGAPQLRSASNQPRLNLVGIKTASSERPGELHCDTNDRLADRFVYIAAMMKSGSTLMATVVNAMLENGVPDPEKGKNAPHNEFLPLTHELLRWFPQGGVYKNHAPISYHTLEFLEKVGCKCIVLLRHPADHVAAYYCHQRGVAEALRTKLGLTSHGRETSWYLAGGPARRYIFNPERASVEEAINHLVEQGYLFKILEWMSEWVKFRDEQRSMVLTYEGLVTDYRTNIQKVHDFIRGLPLGDSLERYLVGEFRRLEAEGEKKSSLDKYPRGWTGSIGTYQRYFSAENARNYNEAVAKFCSCHPHGEALLSVYPNPYVEVRA